MNMSTVKWNGESIRRFAQPPSGAQGIGENTGVPELLKLTAEDRARIERRDAERVAALRTGRSN